MYLKVFSPKFAIWLQLGTKECNLSFKMKKEVIIDVEISIIESYYSLLKSDFQSRFVLLIMLNIS